MFVSAYLPAEIKLPKAVQHNANGDVAIIQFQTYNGVTLQVIAEPNKAGGMDIRIRGWGNKPAKVGNWNRFESNATINLEEATTCEICYNHFGTCGCKIEKAP